MFIADIIKQIVNAWYLLDEKIKQKLHKVSFKRIMYMDRIYVFYFISSEFTLSIHFNCVGEDIYLNYFTKYLLFLFCDIYTFYRQKFAN